MSAGNILSIQVGLPKAYVEPNPRDGAERTWESGIFKTAIEGDVWLGKTNLLGDGQSDLEHHGGPDRAVLLYSAEHYPAWEAVLHRPLEYGSFGENLTVTQLTERNVCLGDRWKTDEVELEVSQPRLPCFKLERRLNTPGMVAQVIAQQNGGWYARVLREGNIRRDQTLKLAERPNPTWTIARAFAVYLDGKKEEEQRELLALPCLSDLWRIRLARTINVSI